MTYRSPAHLTFWTAAALTLTAACGGTAFTSEGSDATGGASAGGGSATGGSPSGGSASGGGAATGGSGTGGTVISGTCQIASDCAAVFDAAAPCYSPGCSVPIAASQQDVAQNHCLVLWDNRNEPAPSDCASTDPVPCPELCIAPPSCVTPLCESGQCQVKLGYTDAECAQSADCDTLNQNRQSALDAARACNPDLDNIQCNATETVADLCGCPLIVNETQPELVQAARKARETWSAACPPPPCPYALCAEPLGGSCGGDGVCAPN